MRVNGEAVRQLRQARELTVTDLAERAGVLRSHLSNVEAQRRQCSPTVIKKLADALRVPYITLIGPDDPEATKAEIAALLDAERLKASA